MVHQATRAIARAMDRVKIRYEIIERGDDSVLRAGFNGQNIHDADVLFISRDEDDDVAVRLFSLVRVPQEKRNNFLRAVNQMNREYRYVKLVLDDDGDVNVEYDFPIESKDRTGDIGVETFIRFMKILDDHVYPELMKYMWM